MLLGWLGVRACLGRVVCQSWQGSLVHHESLQVFKDQFQDVYRSLPLKEQGILHKKAIELLQKRDHDAGVRAIV